MRRTEINLIEREIGKVKNKWKLIFIQNVINQFFFVTTNSDI